MPDPALSLSHSDTFVVRANETDIQGTLAIPGFCNYLQEIAGVHACALGLGIDNLRPQGLTWMMSGLHLVIDRRPLWRESLTVETWPSGNRGRLIATRDFLVHDADGSQILAGVSEWILVEHATHKITRLPEELCTLVPDNIRRASVPEAKKIPELAHVRWAERFTVRRSDIDLNGHANNVHYVEWLWEALPDAFTTRQLLRLDITYRAGAVRGEHIISEATPLDDGCVIHRIRRVSDGALLTRARTLWAPVSDTPVP